MRHRVFADGRAATVGLPVIDRRSGYGDVEMLWIDMFGLGAHRFSW